MKHTHLKTLIVLTLCLGAAGITVPVAPAKDEDPSKPNILWLFADDIAVNAVGVYGSRLAALNPTPNIDRLASQGMRFDQASSCNAICAPSRAVLLTGKHSHMNGKLGNADVFDHDQQQFQKILQQHGYQTALLGKTHLGDTVQGFDYWEIGTGSYFNPKLTTKDGKKTYEGHMTTVLTELATNWMRDGRDKSKPFMMMVHYRSAHSDFRPPVRYADLYEEIDVPEPENLRDQYETRFGAENQNCTIDRAIKLRTHLKIGQEPRGPEESMAFYDARNEYFNRANLQGEELFRWKYQTYVKDYLRTVRGMDDSVGALLRFLEDEGLADNTIVMFSTDQGFFLGEHGWYDKRFMYEESFRIPLIARWPGKIKPGSVNSALVQNIDFAETFLDLAGAPIPGDMQGRSIVPLFSGKTPADWRSSVYYHYYEYPCGQKVRRHEGVFDGRWKLIRFYGQDVPDGEVWELFDLKNDPTEMDNIYNNPESKERIEALKRELAGLRKEYRVPDQTIAYDKKSHGRKGGTSGKNEKKKTP